MKRKLMDFDMDNFGNCAEENNMMIEEVSSKDIAVIGVSLNMPKASTQEEFWKNLMESREFIREIPESRRKDIDDYLVTKGVVRGDMEYKEVAYLDEIDKFDPAFSKIPPREAALMEPSQRLFLETVWGAIEDAGYGGQKLAGTNTGVYVGHSGQPLYKKVIEEIEPQSASMALTGNMPQMISSRICYILDLRGPSMIIDTACSSSLVAVHLACQGLRTRDCDMAIAGAVKVVLMPGKIGEDMPIESSVGRARTFDDSSDGTGGGEGVAAVLLKPLNKAIDDGDNIYAVIKGTVVNQDGNSIGITAPNPRAQEEMILKAWQDSGVHPESISYIEAHGTGTRLGDPIEIEGISGAFQRHTQKKQFCAIGSLKTNIGHLDNAAGIASFTKAVLALKNRQIPASLNFWRPNRKIPFEYSPVYVNDKSTEWNTDKLPRRCGVNAFGMGGTNCHVILEEAPEIKKDDRVEHPNDILTLSAKSLTALKELALRYTDFTKEYKGELLDLSYTSNTGRGHYKWRIGICYKGLDDLSKSLNEWVNNEKVSENMFLKEHKIVNNDKGFMEEGEISDKYKTEISGVAASCAREILDSGFSNEEKMLELLKLYVDGADIDWEELYKDQKYYKVRLPIYPFERKRCWINMPDFEHSLTDIAVEKMFLNSSWVEKTDNGIHDIKQIEKAVVFRTMDIDDRQNKIIEGLKNSVKSVIEVLIGDSFEIKDNDTYIVNGSLNDFERLMNKLRDLKPTHLIFLNGLNNSYENSLVGLEKSNEDKVFMLLNLSKAALSAGFIHDMEIITVAKNSYEVSKDEDLIPENTVLLGFAKVIGTESLYIKSRTIDVEQNTDGEKVVNEILYNMNDEEVAIRGEKRYVPVLDKVEKSSFEDCEVNFKEDGVYLISGGTGGIGLSVAKDFAQKAKVNLALINRSILPQRSQWEEIISKSSDRMLRKKLKKIIEIEKLGAKVKIISADISSYSDMGKIIGNLREEFGTINGVIHAAGVAGDGFIVRRDEEIFRSVLAPKVFGTYILDELTKEDKLDFFVTFSSIASLAKIPGQSDYIAANSYLDTFAAKRKREGKRTLNIQWAGWKETGMAYNYGVNSDGVFKALTTVRAIAAFDKALNSNVYNVAIGEINYMNEMVANFTLPFPVSEEIKKEINEMNSNIKKGSLNSKRAIKLELEGRKDGNYTQTENRVARIWGETLGVEKINIYENYYDMGGDSIIAMKIINMVNMQFDTKVDMSELLKRQTIKDFAAFLDDSTRQEESIYNSIEPVEDKEYYPVSSAQKRIFVVEQYQGVGISYNIPCAVVIEGNLDVRKLEEVFIKIIDRHQALRTSFELMNGEPVQKIHKNISFSMEILEIEEDRTKAVVSDFVRPFDLTKAPLFRACLVRLKSDKFMLMFDMHHIVSDGTSINIMIKEIIDLYKGEELPPLRIQYKDFSTWQNKLFESEAIKAQEEYWLKEFSGELPRLNLPLDFKRPDIQSFEGAAYSCFVDSELTEQIRKLSQKTETTLYMQLITAFSILMSKYARQDEVIIGSGIAGRPHSDLEKIIGMFVNSVALRSQPQGEKTFVQYLSEMKEKILLSFNNQDYQFEKLVEKLDLQRDMSRNPLFDVVFILQNMEAPKLEMEGLKFHLYQGDFRVSKFDITLYGFEGENTINFTFEYCTKLFKESTIKEMFNGLLRVLDQVTSNPQIKLREIEVVDASVRENIVNTIKKGQEFFKDIDNLDF